MADVPALFVAEAGPEPPAGEPVVVFVHGSMDRHRSFGRVISRLADLHSVAYDRRGYSRSRDVLPPARDTADHARDLVAVIAGRPAVVVGHSYGGDVVLTAAAGGAADVRAVLAYEPPLPWFEWWHANLGGTPPITLTDIDPGDAAERFVRRMIGEERFSRMPERSRQALRADGPAFVTELTALRFDEPPFDPAEIGVPVVVARGSLSPERHVRGTTYLAESIPKAELHVLEGVDHGAHISHPDEFAGLVRRALELAA